MQSNAILCNLMQSMFHIFSFCSDFFHIFSSCSSLLLALEWHLPGYIDCIWLHSCLDQLFRCEILNKPLRQLFHYALPKHHNASSMADQCHTATAGAVCLVWRKQQRFFWSWLKILIENLSADIVCKCCIRLWSPCFQRSMWNSKMLTRWPR